MRSRNEEKFEFLKTSLIQKADLITNQDEAEVVVDQIAKGLAPLIQDEVNLKFAYELFDFICESTSNDFVKYHCWVMHGYLLLEAHRYRDAKTEFEKAMSVANGHQPVHSSDWEVLYYRLGECYDGLGDINTAIDYYERTIQVSQNRDDVDSMDHYCFASSNKGIRLFEQNRLPEALHCFQSALDKALKTGLDEVSVDCSIYISNILTLQNKPSEALSILVALIENKSIEIKAEDRAVLYNNIGRVYEELDEFKKAQDYLNLSLKIHPEESKETEVLFAFILGSQASYHMNLGQYDIALPILEKAEKLALKHNEDALSMEIADVFSRLMLHMENYNESIDYSITAISYSNIEPQRKALLYSTLALSLARNRKRSRAKKFSRKSLKLLAAYHQLHDAAAIYGHVAEVYFLDFQYVRALSLFKKAHDTYNGTKVQAPISTVFDLGSCFFYLRAYQQAEPLLQQAIRRVSDSVNRLPLRGQFHYLHDQILSFQLLNFIFHNEERQEDLIANIELSKSWSQKKKVSKVDLKGHLRDLPPEEIVVQYANSDFRILLIQVISSDGVKCIQVDTLAIWKRYSFLLDNLIEQVNESLIDPFFRLAKKRIPNKEKYSQWDILELSILAYRKQLQVKAVSPSESKSTRYLREFLIEVLIHPIQEFLDTGMQIHVIPDLSLTLLPFEAIIDISVSIQYVHSLSDLNKGKRKKNGKVRVLSCSEYSHVTPEVAYDNKAYYDNLVSYLYDINKTLGDGKRIDHFLNLCGEKYWSNLDHVNNEAIAIREIAKNNASLYSSKDKDIRSFLSFNQNCQIIHIAAHSEVNQYLPELSRIVTVKDQDSLDSLTYNEIRKEMRVMADLVVLSSCETALGRVYQGGGMQGLARAFKDAGANYVLSSLWKVNDKFTVLFMQQFYQFVLKQRLPYNVALSRTKEIFRTQTLFGSKYSRPYYWASFVLI